MQRTKGTSRVVPTVTGRLGLRAPLLVAAACLLLAACRSAAPPPREEGEGDGAGAAPAPATSEDGSGASLAPASPSSAAGATAQTSADPEGWRPLLLSEGLGAWKRTDYGGGEAGVAVSGGVLVIDRGEPMNGVTWSGPLPIPTMDYEIALEAKRVEGGDFFCGLTFPVRESAASLIVGGWGGGLCGISSFDHMDASENETGEWHELRDDHWYDIRLRLTEKKIEAWLDGVKIVDAETTGRQIDVRWEVEPNKPLGIATYETKGALRRLRWRPVPAAAPEPTGG